MLQVQHLWVATQWIHEIQDPPSSSYMSRFVEVIHLPFFFSLSK